MRIRWTPAAAADLEQISEYLKQRLIELAQRRLPVMRVREEGTRELVFSPLPYIAVYRLKGPSIEVLRIYHGARNVS